MKRQTRQVLEYLQAGNTITQEQAQRLFNCWRLASRISELRNDYGYSITTYRIPVQTEDGEKRSFAKYAMTVAGARVSLWEGCSGPVPLQPCPVCGAAGVETAITNAPGILYAVLCKRCAHHTRMLTSAQDAAEEWNNNEQEDNT